VVAVLLGWLILHEQINRYIVVGAVIIVGSVVLVTLSKLKSPATQAAGILPACEAEA
jgi:drug/metabolite transporter (DMT)-like permease